MLLSTTKKIILQYVKLVHKHISVHYSNKITLPWFKQENFSFITMKGSKINT